MNEYLKDQETGNPAPEGRAPSARSTSPLPDLHAAWPVPAAPPSPAPARKPRARSFPGLLLAGMLLLNLLFGGAGAGIALLIAGNTATAAPISTPAPVASTTTSTGVQPVAQVDAETISAIYQEVSPSVVMIDSIIGGSGRFRAAGEATGTGIVVDKQGTILTNYHVIQNATSIKVELADGKTYPATVIGSAPQDDLALIKADAPADQLVPATFGDSSTVQVGDAVIAIGYPFGLDQSVTSGIVSGLNRSSGGQSSRTLSGLIQIDAAINPGNSGGPLLNAQGEVIGINTMIESPVEAFTGIGLAIPINHAKSLLPQIEQGGEVQRPWLGISGTEITTGLQEQYNLPVSTGILVAEVVAGGPAATAGLQGAPAASQDGTPTNQFGDIITTVDGQNVGSVAELTSYLNGKQPGDKVTLGIIRNSQAQTLQVTLQAWPESTSNTDGN